MSTTPLSAASHATPFTFNPNETGPNDQACENPLDNHEAKPEKSETAPINLRQLLGNPEHKSAPFCAAVTCPSDATLPFAAQIADTRQCIPNGLPARCFSMSGDGENLLKSVEELRLEPYDDRNPSKKLDQWNKFATIGYGHLISKSEWSTYKKGIDKNQADLLFQNDLKPFADAVRSSISTNLQQYQFDALVMLAYNIGIGGFKGSSVVKMINDPCAKNSYATLEDAWKAWNKTGGKVSQGLINRRDAEWKVFTQATYEKW